MSFCPGRLASVAFGLGLLVSAQSLADSGSASPRFSRETQAEAGSRAAGPQPTRVAADVPPPQPLPEESAPDGVPTPKPDAAQLSAMELAEFYKSMSSTSREALEQILKTKGIDALSKMSESDARQTFGGLAPNVRAEIQQKWDGLTDEQRIALKNLKPDDIKDMVAAQAKEIVQASVAPIMKPAETILEDTKAFAAKTASFLKKGRDYVRALIARLTGSAPSEDRAQDDANPTDKN